MIDRKRVRPRRGAEAAGLALLKSGLYTVPAASRLLHVDGPTIRRWAFGYDRGGMAYTAAITSEIPPVDHERVLTFLELVELMFIKSVLGTGLSWPKLREASRAAARLLAGDPHPFASEKWFADAAGLYLKLGRESGESILVEVAGYGQVSMEEVLRPYLSQLHFDEHGVPQRWYPLGRARPVVLDPRRAFGMPITERDGVPTDAIRDLNRAGDSVATIAAWFRTQEADIEAAIEYEASLAGSA